MRKCKHCGFEGGQEFFYKSAGNSCKTCTKAKMAKWQRDNKEHYNFRRNLWRQKNRERENAKARKWDRDRYWRNPDAARARMARQWRENPEVFQRARKRAAQKWPERDKARRAIYYLVSTGVITRPDRCEKCGASGKIEAHHEDYSDPLRVQWLCLKCHGATRRITA